MSSRTFVPTGAVPKEFPSKKQRPQFFTSPLSGSQAAMEICCMLSLKDESARKSVDNIISDLVAKKHRADIEDFFIFLTTSPESLPLSDNSVSKKNFENYLSLISNMSPVCGLEKSVQDFLHTLIYEPSIGNCGEPIELESEFSWYYQDEASAIYARTLDDATEEELLEVADILASKGGLFNKQLVLLYEEDQFKKVDVLVSSLIRKCPQHIKEDLVGIYRVPLDSVRKGRPIFEVPARIKKGFAQSALFPVPTKIAQHIEHVFDIEDSSILIAPLLQLCRIPDTLLSPATYRKIVWRLLIERELVCPHILDSFLYYKKFASTICALIDSALPEHQMLFSQWLDNDNRQQTSSPHLLAEAMLKSKKQRHVNKFDDMIYSLKDIKEDIIERCSEITCLRYMTYDDLIEMSGHKADMMLCEIDAIRKVLDNMESSVKKANKLSCSHKCVSGKAGGEEE